MAEGKPRALRAVARCSSLEEFIAGFARFAEPERLFVITSDPKPVGGPARPFIIQLADGSTALRGVGEIVEQHLIPTGPEGKCGMWLRLVDLTPASKEVHRQLLDRREQLQARAAASVPPPVPAAAAPRPLPGLRPLSPLAPLAPPESKRGATIRVPAVVPPVIARAPRVPEATPPPGPAPVPPTSAAPSIATATAAVTPMPARALSMREELIEKAHRLAGPSPHREERVPPSPVQLPANPLAMVDDDALDVFVECTLYEHTDLAEVSDFSEPTDVQAIVYDPTSGLPPSPIGEPIGSIGSMAVVAAGSPSPTAIPVAAPVPVIAAPVMAEPPPFYVPPPATSRRALAVVAAASVAIGIGGGWLLFGSTGKAAPGPQPQRPAAGAASAAGTAAAPAPATAPASGSASVATTATAPASGSASKTEPAAAPAAASAPKTEAAAAAAPKTEPAAAAMAAAGCTAHVITSPPDVHVQWGSLDLGQSPVASASVPCGPAEVTLTRPRYTPVNRKIDAQPDAPAALNVPMQRPPATITLRSIPPGATFTINGASAGRGPVTAKVPGFEPLHITATLPGYAPWHGSAKVNGASGAVFARMTRAANPKK